MQDRARVGLEVEVLCARQAPGQMLELPSSRAQYNYTYKEQRAAGTF